MVSVHMFQISFCMEGGKGTMPGKKQEVKDNNITEVDMNQLEISREYF